MALEQQKNYWLFKSEPNVWSWTEQKNKGYLGEPWTGVRNYVARNHMREMKLGEQGFFYHSNKGLEIVGIVEVCALSHLDATTEDPRWECVDIRAVKDLPQPVSLKQIKQNPRLAQMQLVTHSRLSVQKVLPQEWDEICNMAGL